MIWFLLQHLVAVTMLAVCVALLCRLFRNRPALHYGLWLVVLTKLLFPPLITWPWSAQDLVNALGGHGDWLVAHLGRSREPSSRIGAAPGSDREPGTGHVASSDTSLVPGRLNDDGSKVSEVELGEAALAGATLPTPGAAQIPGEGLRWRVPVLSWALFGAWVSGSLVALMLCARKTWRIRRSLSRVSGAPAWLTESVAQMAHRLGVRAPNVLLSHNVDSPSIICIPRLTLLWPIGLAERNAVSRTRGILIHELAHIRRRDHWFVWLELLVKIVWWWNPISWYVDRRLRESAELACDAWVIRLLPSERRSYAHSLVTMCQRASYGARLVPAAGARTGSARAFQRRLTMIMCNREPASPMRSAWVIVGLVLLVALPCFSLGDKQPGNAAGRSSEPVPAPATDLPAEIDYDEDTSPSTPKATKPAPPEPAAPGEQPAGTPIGDGLLEEVLRRVEETHMKEVNKEELIQAAIEAVLKKLDKDSRYLGHIETKRLQQSLKELVGVGARLQMREGRLEVMNTLPSSPAKNAGLQPGDVIEQIDGAPVEEGDERQGLAAAVLRIRGKRGEPVTLGVRRKGSDSIMQIRIVRDTVKVDTICGYSRRSDGTWRYIVDEREHIGYVCIRHFATSSAKDLDAVVHNLLERGMRGLVLDLRDCPGGLLGETTAIADVFVSTGTIVTISRRDSTGDEQFLAHEAGTYSGFPVAVLVNRATASASEILAACLQDHQRATIVGERTYGRGIVQKLIPLSTGTGALKITAASFQRPSGKGIHRFEGATESDAWGVKPDKGFELTLSPDEIKAYLKARAQRDSATADPAAFDDRQLNKALEYLRQELRR